jgi:MFS superfamily sulfate permease-like transporter
VVIAASFSLADFSGMRRLWRQRRSDFYLAMTAFLGVALLGVLPGIGLAVAMSILDVFSRVWRPYEAVLGRVPGMAGYHDSRVNPTAAHLPGLVIYRFDGPLFFANANTFRDKVLQLAGSDPRPTWVLVAAEPITEVDTTAADMLEDLDLKINENGTSLVFAEMKTPVRTKVERYELTGVIEPNHFFGTIEEAVQAYQDQTGATWVTGADTSP